MLIFNRKKIRGMGRVSQMATFATENALLQSGLLTSDGEKHDVLTNGKRVSLMILQLEVHRLLVRLE